MVKENSKKNMDPDWNNLVRDDETIYIICPDLNCEGFIEDNMWCESKGTYFPSCPKKDKHAS